MATKGTQLELSLKRGIVKGILNTSPNAENLIIHFYNIVLNDSLYTKLKPFNYIKNKTSICDSSGIFMQWMAFVTDNNMSLQDSNNSGRRIQRALDKLAKEYEDIMPEKLRGEGVFSMLTRVFYVPSSAMLNYSHEAQAAIEFVSYLFKVILLLDMLTDGAELSGKPAEYWLEVLFSSAVNGTRDIINMLDYSSWQNTTDKGAYT